VRHFDGHWIHRTPTVAPNWALATHSHPSC
jgi:hypothetical protein